MPAARPAMVSTSAGERRAWLSFIEGKSGQRIVGGGLENVTCDEVEVIAFAENLSDAKELYIVDGWFLGAILLDH